MEKNSVDKTWENYQNKVKLEHDGQVRQEYLRVIGHFRSYCGEKPATTEVARDYLQRFLNLSRNTRSRYTDIINGVLKAFGQEKVTRVKVPKREPKYIPGEEFATFFEALRNRKKYKQTITRDVLLFRLMDATGLRSNEAATLRVCDLFLDGHYENDPYLVAHGKGSKDRSIPLIREMAQELKAIIKDKKPEDLVFGLKAKSIVNKFYEWKKKAGVSLSSHDLRRHFATELNASGADIRTTQQLMGHLYIETTQGYIGLPQQTTREAIQRRQDYIQKRNNNPPPDVLKNPNSGKPEGFIELPHKNKIRELAKALVQNIVLPSVMVKDLWKELQSEFRSGKYYLPLGEVDIDQDKQIKVKYPDITLGIAEPHLTNGLISHLATSDVLRFKELTGKDGLFNNLAVKAGEYSQSLLEFLRLITDEVKKREAKLNFLDNGQPGLTRWFPMTIWIDAIQKASGHNWIHDSWYHPPEHNPSNLWQLKCGGYIIGYSHSKNRLDIYEDWHKRLRTHFTEDKFAKDISIKNSEMTDLLQYIKVRLLEFSDMERIRGQCELC